MNVLLDAETIQARVKEMAREVERDYSNGEEIHLVCVLKGGFVFMSDLMRSMSTRVSMDFIAVSSYGAGTKSSGEVRFQKDLDTSLENRNVIDPPKSGAEEPQDGMSAEQAVAAAGRGAGRVRRLHDRRQVRRRLRPRLR